MIMRYPYPTIESWIESTLKRSDPNHKYNEPDNYWKGGVYSGDLPLGESWGIVYSCTPDIWDTLAESNWESMLTSLESFEDQYSIVGVKHWATWLDLLAVELIDSENKPTPIAKHIYDLLIKLADHPVLNEDHLSQLESEAQDSALTESLNSAVWSSDFYALFVDSAIEDQLFQYAYQHYDSEISESEGWIADTLGIQIVNRFVWDILGYAFMGI